MLSLGVAPAAPSKGAVAFARPPPLAVPGPPLRFPLGLLSAEAVSEFTDLALDTLLETPRGDLGRLGLNRLKATTFSRDIRPRGAFSFSIPASCLHVLCYRKLYQVRQVCLGSPNASQLLPGSGHLPRYNIAEVVRRKLRGVQKGGPRHVFRRTSFRPFAR